MNDLSSLASVLCPSCRSPLSEEGERASCPGCHRAYPVRSGVVLLSPTDDLYEDMATESYRVPAFERSRGVVRLLARLDFHLSNKQARPRFIHEAVQELAGGTPRAVLDLGCGGGKEVLTRLGPVVGVDLSLKGLANARRMYRECIRHDIRAAIPFPDASFDVVCCADVLGHFRPDDRNRVLSEVRRVLRPGGHLIAIVETWSDLYETNRRRFPAWYPAFLDEMVARTGHIDLEPAGKARNQIEDAGFIIVRQHLIGGAWGYAHGHLTWATERYPPTSRREALLRKLSVLAIQNLYVESALDDALGILDLPVTRRLADADALAIMILARREPAPPSPA